MVAIAHTPVGDFVDSEAFQEAIDRRAERWSNWIEILLETCRIPLDVFSRLPQCFAADVAACIEIWTWELEGLRPVLAAEGLPASVEAARAVRAQAKQFKSDYPQSANSLHMQVLRVGLQKFAWNSFDDSRAPILIDIDVDNEDAFIEEMARFLFEHRDLAES